MFGIKDIIGLGLVALIGYGLYRAVKGISLPSPGDIGAAIKQGLNDFGSSLFQDQYEKKIQEQEATPEYQKFKADMQNQAYGGTPT